MQFRQMLYRFAYLRLVASIGFAALSSGAFAAIDWAGEYAYTATYGRSAGGSPIGVEYRAKLGRSAGATACEIQITGFQIDEEIICSTRPSGNTVVLLFQSYKSGELRNLHGIQVHSPGQALLSFSYQTAKGKSLLSTQWLGLTGLDGKRPQAPRTFKRLAPK